jgi:hypothetical protein
MITKSADQLLSTEGVVLSKKSDSVFDEISNDCLDHLSYDELFALYQKEISRNIVAELSEPMEQEAEVLYKKYLPKRKKRNWQDVPENERIALETKYRNLFRNLTTIKELRLDILNRKLFEKASTVDMTPQNKKRICKKSSGGSYLSQGYGANRYAYGSLCLELSLLKEIGFDAEILLVATGEPNQWGVSYHVYELVANCTEAQFDAVCRLGATTEKWIASMKKQGLNPKVYRPFLKET